MSQFSPLNTVLQFYRIPGLINKSAANSRSADLHPIEKSYIIKANHKRTQEFITGRFCAKKVLAELGVKVNVIPRDEHRAPVWPENVTGSISHSGRLCASIVAFKNDYLGIGLDIEQKKILKPAMAEYICNEDELKYIEEKNNPYLAVLFFSAKEALYKCLVQATEFQLGFKDVSINIASKDSFSIEFHNHPIDPKRFTCWYRLGPKYVYSLVTMI